MQPDYYANTMPSTIDSGAAAAAGGFMVVNSLFWLIFVVISLVAMWKIFTKAGKPGWATLIPIYNIFVELQIIQKPVWWILLLFIPVINIVVLFIMVINLGKAFGKGALWSIILLLIFSPIGMLMLAFGKSEYQYGSQAATPNVGQPPQPMSNTVQPPQTVAIDSQTPPVMPPATTATPESPTVGV